MTIHEEAIQLLNDHQYTDAYRLVFTNWADGLNIYIPNSMQGGLVRYILRGVHPGEFLEAFLKGDLFEAMRCADSDNIHIFHMYDMFLYNNAPGNAYGSLEIYDEWTKTGGILGQTADAKETTA